MLLGVLRTSIPLQSPGALPWPLPSADMYLERGATFDESPRCLGRLLGVSKQMTWSETSDFETFNVSPARAVEDTRYCDSIPTGSSDAGEWVPPDDWQLPPASADASRLHDMQSIDSEGGPSGDIMGAATNSVQAIPHSWPSGPRSDCPPSSPPPVEGWASHEQIIWNRRQMCDVCKLAEASRASVKLKGKHGEWAFFACRSCASAAGTQHQTQMISLRGRCTRCPRTATFAPPSCPRHISIHCKEHKWEGEIGRAKRLSGVANGLARLRRGERSTSLRHSMFVPQDALSAADRAVLMENDESDCTFSGVPSSERASRRDGIVKTSNMVRGRSVSVSTGEFRLARHTQARNANGSYKGRSHSCSPVLFDLHSDMREVGDEWDPLCVAAGVWETCSEEPSTHSDKAQAPAAGATTKTWREHGYSATAAFGRTIDGSVRACQKQKGVGEVRMALRRKAGICSYSGGCLKRASFGDAQQGVAHFCVTHKLPWHTNVRATRCTALACRRHSTFGPPSSRKPLLCAEHRGEGDVDLRHARRASPTPVQSRRSASSSSSSSSSWSARELLATAAQLTHLKNAYLLQHSAEAEARPSDGSIQPSLCVD
jgi:hypothetical protein